MTISKLNCYENFKCLAGDCPDTCCAGWTVAIDKTTYAKYVTANCSKDFNKKINKNLIKCRVGYCTKLKNKRCAFLTNDNLCEIYINLGENYLSEVCKNHPRFINDYGALREVNFSLSCPLAVGLLLDEKDLKITAEEIDYTIIPNDIDADYYSALKSERDLALNIAKSNLSIDKKIKELYLISNKKYIDFNANFVAIIKAYLACSFTRKELKSALKNLLKTGSLTSVNYDNSTEINNLLFAYIFRFWTAPLFDKNALNVEFIATSISTILALKSTFKVPLDKLISLYSREIIHCDKNMQKINKTLKKLQ